MVKKMFAPTDEVWYFQLTILDILDKQGLTNNLLPEEVEYINRGQAKFVYSIPTNKLKLPSLNSEESKLIATAIPLESHYDLSKEFSLLKTIYEKFSNKYTPKPEFYLETLDTKLMGMEFIDLDVIGNFVEKNWKNKLLLEYVSFIEGSIVGQIYKETGLFHVEPHDENIMVGIKNNKIDVKFIDALHFEKGSLDELFDTYLKNYIGIRTEIASYKDAFVSGFNSEYLNKKK
jgi:hypothetical protein